MAHAHNLAADSEKSSQEWIRMFDSGEAQRDRKRQTLEEMYSKYPTMAPTASQRTAERLRDQADEIEGRAGLDQLVSMHRKFAADARRCEQVIIGKLRPM